MSSRIKVAVIDPSLFTLPYDVHLCTGIANASGSDVILYGRELREGEVCRPIGFCFDPWYYRRSSRMGAGGRLIRPIRNTIKAFEHVIDTVRLIRFFRNSPPSVVHFQWFPIPLVDQLAVKYLRRRGIPVLWTVHDTTPFNAAPSSRGQNLAWEKSLKSVDALIVHTEQSKRRLLDMGVCVPIEVIPHGTLSFGKMPPGKPRTALSILFFGGIRPHKGLDTLLRAFAGIKDRGKVELRIVGNCAQGPYEIDRLIHELGIEESVRFECRFFSDEEIPSILAEGDLVVFPYRRIDASGAFLTAIHYAKPFIATDVGIFAELVKDGRYALVSPGSVEELREKLDEVIHNSKKLEQLRTISSQIASEITDWREIGARTVAAYKRAGLREPSTVSAFSGRGDSTQNRSRSESPSNPDSTRGSNRLSSER